MVSQESFVAEFYAHLDDAIASGRREAVEAWVKDALEDFNQNATLMSATHQIAAADPGYLTRLGSGFRYITHMPKLMGGCPPGQRAELEFRLNSMVSLLDRTWMRIRSQSVSPELSADDITRTLADIFLTTLSWYAGASAPARHG